MSEFAKLAVISVIFLVAFGVCVCFWWYPIPGDVEDPLCPTAFVATENNLIKTPSALESYRGKDYAFEEFCALVVEENPNLISLHHDIVSSSDEELVTVVLFAYIKGLEKPLRTEKRLEAPFMGQFDLSPEGPGFSDGGLVLPVKKDIGQGDTLFSVVAIAAIFFILVVIFWDYPL